MAIEVIKTAKNAFGKHLFTICIHILLSFYITIMVELGDKKRCNVGNADLKTKKKYYQCATGPLANSII
jgi:hypothetical protein